MLSGAQVTEGRRAPRRMSCSGPRAEHGEESSHPRRGPHHHRGLGGAGGTRDEIAKHDRAYFEHDAPTVSDAEYDALRQRNEAIEARFPELIREDFSFPPRWRGCGGEVRQDPPRGALALPRQRASRREDGADFVGRIRRFLNLGEGVVEEITAEPKIDGPIHLAFATRTASWCRRQRAATVYEGENVTANVMTIAQVPKSLTGLPPNWSRCGARSNVTPRLRGIE